jgi:hypothetical protein
MSDARKLEDRQSIYPLRCECGNSADAPGGGVFPCDSEGRRMAFSDLVYCDRCDKIFVRETGQHLRYRSLITWATASW